ncbi:MAG TPA: hypothetical protein VIW29_08105 [Polyangiaceae bacterium]
MTSPAQVPIPLSPARQLAAAWYFNELWGWSPQEVPPPEALSAFMKALLVCANGDGRLSDEERRWVLERAAIAGATDSSLEELSQYDADDDIEALLAATGDTNETRPSLIYAAIKAASADRDYADAERRVIGQAARALGVESAEVAAIERIVRREERLKQERLCICFPEGNPFEPARRRPNARLAQGESRTIGRARELAARWYYRELWGWQLDDISCGCGRGTFLKALMICANGDGLLTGAERSWVLGRAAAAGAPEALLQELDSYPADESLDVVVHRTPATDRSRRAIIYLAILAARSDQNYAGGERRAIQHAAARLGLREEEMSALEHLIAAEAHMKTERVARCLTG